MFLQVIYTLKRSCRLKTKEFDMTKTEQAFNKFWKCEKSQIVLRESSLGYDPSFSELRVSDLCQKYGGKEEYQEEYMRWLTQVLEMIEQEC